MYFLQFSAQLNPEISFEAPNFNTYVNGLAENFMLVVLLFFAAMLLAFIFYCALSILFLFLNRVLGPINNFGESEVHFETPENA